MSETNEDAPCCTHGNGKRATCQLCILEDFQMRTPAEFATALSAARAQVETLKADLAAVRKVETWLSRKANGRVEARVGGGFLAVDARHLPMPHGDSIVAHTFDRSLIALGSALAAQEGNDGK